MHIFPNDKKYIGITKQNVCQRWGHKGNGYKKQPVYDKILEYGWENIQHKIIYENLTREEAQKKEKELIQKYNTIEDGYNISKGGGAGGESWCKFYYNETFYSAEEIAKLSPYNIDGHDVTTRVNHHGWDLEKAINTPKGKKNIKFLYEGQYYTVRELYNIRINQNITLEQLKNRLLKYNWDVKRAITQSSNVKKQPKGVGTCKFEYNGKIYNSYELCLISDVEDLKPQDITDRINRRGWSIERAITQPKRRR